MLSKFALILNSMILLMLATVRGQVISYISQARRAERVRLEEITDELGKIDEVYSASPFLTLYKNDFFYILNMTSF